MFDTLVFVVASSLKNTRLQKIAQYLYSKQTIRLEILAWLRDRKDLCDDNKFISINYLVKSGGYGGTRLIFYYLVFIIKGFCELSKRSYKNKVFFAINFESGLILYLLSLFRQDVIYIYEIRDEFTKSHKMPSLVTKLVDNVEIKIRKRAFVTIHVDDNRLSNLDNNAIVIYNAPYDFFKGDFILPAYKKKFAVTGWLSSNRGMDSIYHFAYDNPSYEFIIAGRFTDSSLKRKFIDLPNVVYYDFMPQNTLFSLIKDCQGIFSLYDPSLEINRLAASNKLYDAMMLGIPVIVNFGILAADYVEKNGIGYVVNYLYDETWKILLDRALDRIEFMGNNGREIYYSNYELTFQLDSKLLPILKKLDLKF